MREASAISYISKSGQLTLDLLEEKRILKGVYIDLGQVSPEEYVEYMSFVGSVMEKERIGKLLLDMSKLSHFSINLRAVAINNVGPLVISKAPFFVLAILKPKSVFESLATEAALKAAKPLSKKFLDGKMFQTEEEALQWLQSYEVPAAFR